MTTQNGNLIKRKRNMKDSKTNMLGQIKLNMKITMMQEKMEMKL
jgi:hypothetical protein